MSRDKLKKQLDEVAVMYDEMQKAKEEEEDELYCQQCDHLNFTEEDQVGSRPHICRKYNCRVLHMNAHPNLYRLQICVEENGKE